MKRGKKTQALCVVEHCFRVTSTSHFVLWVKNAFVTAERGEPISRHMIKLNFLIPQSPSELKNKTKTSRITFSRNLRSCPVTSMWYTKTLSPVSCWRVVVLSPTCDCCLVLHVALIEKNRATYASCLHTHTNLSFYGSTMLLALSVSDSRASRDLFSFSMLYLYLPKSISRMSEVLCDHSSHVFEYLTPIKFHLDIEHMHGRLHF